MRKRDVCLLFAIAILILAACSPAPAPTRIPEPSPTSQATQLSVTATASATTQASAPTVAAQEAHSQASQLKAPTPAPAQPTTLTIWHQWSSDDLIAIDQVIQDYQSSHPNLTINLSRPADLASALAIAVPAGQGPDVIDWTNDQIGDQAHQGNIIPLSDMNVVKDMLAGIYEPAALEAVTWQNKIWALPESETGLALVYNKDLVKDEYLPQEPFNFADLLDKATKFKTDTGAILVCNAGFGSSDATTAMYLAPIFFGFGIPGYINEDGKAYLDTPEALNAAKWLVDFAKVSQSADTQASCLSDFKDGKVGMWWTGPDSLAAIEAAKINYGILPMGKPFVTVKALMLTQNALNRGNASLALDFIRYMTSPDVQKKLAAINQSIPTASAVFQDPQINKIPVIGGYGAALASGVAMSPSLFAKAQWDPVGKAGMAIWTGSQPPGAALQDAQKAIEDAVVTIKKSLLN